MLEPEEIEEVAEKVVENVSLIHLSYGVPVYGCLWEPQPQPLLGGGEGGRGRGEWDSC